MTANVGYVGLNHHHSEPYLRSLDQLPVDVTCACEPAPAFDPASVGLSSTVPLYRSTESLLENEDVDVLWLALSNAETPKAISTAAQYGVDVFTEKPAARTATELEPVIDTVKDAGITVGVSYIWRGHPISKKLYERAADGFFGSVRAFDTRFVAPAVSHRDTSHYLFDGTASRGGILQWLGVHWIDLLPWILDDPIRHVDAATSTKRADIDVEDGAAVILETESGAIGTVQTGYYLGQDRYDTRIGIYGTEGTAEWDPVGRTFRFDGETVANIERVNDDWGEPRQQINHDYRPMDGYGGQWGLNFIKQFLKAREGDGCVPADLTDAQETLRVLDAVYEVVTSEQGTPVNRST